MSIGAIALSLALLSGAPAEAAGPEDTRAAELAKLRREVEAASSDLVLHKEDLRNQLKPIEAQKIEIEVQIRREELRLAQIEGEAQARRAELAASQTGASTLGPVLLESIDRIRASVATSLPFHLPERLGELDTLRQQVASGVITPEAGVARLWAFTEDELRLARENGLDRQVVPLPDGEVLASVARLGMAALYFQTDGGVVGGAVQDGGRWSWSVYESRADQLAVLDLMEKLRHGVRTGSFELPNPAPRQPTRPATPATPSAAPSATPASNPASNPAPPAAPKAAPPAAPNPAPPAAPNAAPPAAPRPAQGGNP